MITILLIVIVSLVVVLFVQRSSRWSNSRPMNRPDYYDPPSYGQPPSFGGTGTFLGGMAAGALLTWLLEQGRINMEQYDYFSNLDDQRMIDELMHQNIVQQEEIDHLQRQVDGQGYGNDNWHDPTPPFPDAGPGNHIHYDTNDDRGYGDDNNNGDWV